MNCLFSICREHLHESCSTIDVCFRHDSRSHDRSCDFVKAVQEQFLWRFIATTAKSARCVHEEKNVESTVWLWILQDRRNFKLYEQNTRRLRDVNVCSQLNLQHCQFVDRSRVELRFKHKAKIARWKSSEIQRWSDRVFWQDCNNCWQSSRNRSFLSTKFSRHRQDFRISNSLSSLQSAKRCDVVRDFFRNCSSVIVWQSNVSFSFQDFNRDYDEHRLQHYLQFTFVQFHTTYKVDHLRRDFNAA